MSISHGVLGQSAVCDCVSFGLTNALKWTKGQIYVEFGIRFTSMNIDRLSTKPHRASSKATSSRCPLRPFMDRMC